MLYQGLLTDKEKGPKPLVLNLNFNHVTATVTLDALKQAERAVASVNIATFRLSDTGNPGQKTDPHTFLQIIRFNLHFNLFKFAF